jgi:hypothetical protein
LIAERGCQLVSLCRDGAGQPLGWRRLHFMLFGEGTFVRRGS